MFNKLKLFSGVLITLFFTSLTAQSTVAADRTPNVILLMADDLGWGDVGFNGNQIVKTPNLDEMAAQGLRLNRFYTASSICSPTRASVMTGRHPYRSGILAAHTAGMRNGEFTIGEAMKLNGYATGFFGKWHLGHLELDKSGGRGHYSPPWHHGFDETFATTNAVPTWDPQSEGETYYHNEVPVTESLRGDDSRIIMDKAIPFIRENVENDKPFLATIWFHAPHEPVVAGPEYLQMYKNLTNKKQRHFYGAITAMDEQIGRVRALLRELGVEDDTVIFFTSDNGPSGPLVRAGVASAGLLRGTKHWHYDGGIRVPSLVEWPNKIAPGTKSDTLAGTVDYFPTLLKLANVDADRELKGRPIDGMSLLETLRGVEQRRETGIVSGYRRLYKNEDGIALIEGDWKIIRPKKKSEIELYNLIDDPYEENNVSSSYPWRVTEMADRLEAFMQSARKSRDGADYPY